MTTATANYQNGFEFLFDGQEAMIWSSQLGSQGWVYIVVVGWSTFSVMTEKELDKTLNL